MGDIYESRFSNGQWQTAVALPAPVNGHFTTEMGPCIANDGRTLWYLRQQNPDQFDYQIVTSIDTTVLSIEPRNQDIAANFKLYPSYPNPFNSTTQLRFELSKPSHVELSIVNTLGRRTAVLADEDYAAGFHAVSWDASGLASGVYFAQLRAGDQTRVVKMVLMK